MIRSILFLMFFLLLAIVQYSFFTSLPGILRLFPLILTVGVYLLQHQSSSVGAWLIVANGLFVDFYELQMVPMESISCILAALVAGYLAKHVFSNRSLYGVLACGIVVFGVIKISQICILGLVWIRNAEDIYWHIFYQETLWSLGLLIIGLILLFPFATRIKQLLNKSFLISEREIHKF